MNIKLKNADFSANKISIVPDFFNLSKTATNISLVVLGTQFVNGDKLRWRIVIDDVGAYGGISVPFAFCTGSSTPGNISTYELNPPHATLQLAVGSSYEGEIILSKIGVVNVYLKFATFNVDYNAIKWHLDYYVIS